MTCVRRAGAEAAGVGSAPEAAAGAEGALAGGAPEAAEPFFAGVEACDASAALLAFLGAMLVVRVRGVR